MILYLVNGFLDYAATSLADAKLLLAALADPSTAANSATIARVTQKIQTLVQSDSGEPLTISSIDDTSGTISSWVTDSSVTLALGLGDQDPSTAYTYASTTSFSISGSTRVGTLALNTTNLVDALNVVAPGRPGTNRSPGAARLVIHIRTSEGETVGMIPVRVIPGVLSDTPEDMASTSYVSTTAARAGYVINAGGVTSMTGGGSTALDGLDAGSDDYPVGCILVTSNSSVGRFWKLLGTYIAASDVDNGLVKPTSSDAVINPCHWKLI